VRSLRFLVSRRWILFFVVVMVLAYATWWLGEWQFHRLEDRKADNATIIRNLARPADDVADVMSVGRPVAEADQWRHVRAEGTYDEEHTVVIRYRTRDGASGVDVVVPLVTDGGSAVLVDRGWLETDNIGADPDDVPDPPSGRVTIGGYLRGDGAGDSTRVRDGSARAISSVEIGKTLPYPVYGGFVDLQVELPEAADPLTPGETPDLGNGPHFFYGLQWWFFGLLAVFGFCYLAYDEWRGPRRPQTARSMPPSTGNITPEMNEEAGDSRKAAARPNSSGSP
jgi:cytochrome oxidase assembly protein ShyY1